jgi:AcrR family transcriptional regulator
VGRRKDEPENIREIILDAADKLFSRFGFKKTAVDEIVRLAKVAKGTFYNYFDSKDDVILSVFRREQEKMVSGLKSQIDGEKDVDAKLKQVLVGKLDAMGKSPILAQVLSEKRELLSAGLDQELEHLDTLETSLIEEILRDGNTQLSLAELELEESARAIQHALKGLELSYMDGNQKRVEQDADVLIGMIFDGLKKKTSAT